MTAQGTREILLQEWQRTFNDRDWDAHCALYTQDIVFSIPPGLTVLNGQVELRGALERFTTRYLDIRLTVRRASTEGDIRAVEWDEIGTESESGDDAVFLFCGMLEVHNGLIAKVARYGGKRP